MGAPSDQFLRLIWRPPYACFFLQYYIGPHSDQFLCLLYDPPPLRLVSLHAIGGPPQISCFTKYMGAPSDQFFRLLYGAHSPQVSFFAYYIGPPQISFCAYCLEVPLRSVFSLTIWGPSDQFFLDEAPSDQFLHILYGGLLRSISSLTIWAPLRSVSSLTI